MLEYSQQQGEYGVVIDIGRLGARIHVLQFEGTETVAVRVLGRKHSLATVKVPILLGDFLEYAKGHVPASERAQTRVYVLGTGGLEWIPVQNRLDMLQECRKIIHESEFMFHDDWAMVLNGRDEGVYEWVAANYARSMVQSDPTDTIGVLNLGDESAQVTFVSEKAPPFAYFHKIELRGTTHNLYSYSFDKLGLETASRRLLKLLHARTVASSTGGSGNKVVLDPCSPRGFGGGTATTIKSFPTTPSGNFTACRAESLALLQQGQEACHEKNCPVGTIFVPELRGKFIATGKFYETSKYFRLPAMASLPDLVAAGESYCGGAVGDFLKDPFAEYEAARKPCFSAAFIVAFLHDSLGLPVSGSKVMFMNAVNSVPVEWTVGFFLTHVTEKKKMSKPNPPIIMFEGFSGNVALFLGLLALISVLWFVARWRRPQLKTIYDLEKGRYFTTAARGR